MSGSRSGDPRDPATAASEAAQRGFYQRSLDSSYSGNAQTMRMVADAKYGAKMAKSA